jgi:hypothetical protein
MKPHPRKATERIGWRQGVLLALLVAGLTLLPACAQRAPSESSSGTSPTGATPVAEHPDGQIPKSTPGRELLDETPPATQVYLLPQTIEKRPDGLISYTVEVETQYPDRHFQGEGGRMIFRSTDALDCEKKQVYHSLRFSHQGKGIPETEATKPLSDIQPEPILPLPSGPQIYQRICGHSNPHSNQQ